MILLEVEANWYWFLVFTGIILIGAIIILVFQYRSSNEEILHLKPLDVLRNIALNQAGFYLVYLFVAFTVDITCRERFNVYQVFSSLEHSFNTQRGGFTTLAQSLAMGSAAIVYSAVVQTYRNMADYCFTVFVLHFIVVSIVQGEFPSEGSWWTASGVGLIFSMIIGERMSYALETMSYQSSLSGPTRKHETSTKEATELPELEEEFMKVVRRDSIQVAMDYANMSDDSDKVPVNDAKEPTSDQIHKFPDLSSSVAATSAATVQPRESPKSTILKSSYTEELQNKVGKEQRNNNKLNRSDEHKDDPSPAIVVSGASEHDGPSTTATAATATSTESTLLSNSNSSVASAAESARLRQNSTSPLVNRKTENGKKFKKKEKTKNNKHRKEHKDPVTAAAASSDNNVINNNNKEQEEGSTGDESSSSPSTDTTQPVRQQAVI